MIKLATMSSVCPDWTLDEIIPAMKRHGYTGLEPRVEWKHACGIEKDLGMAERGRIKARLADEGLEVCCIATGVRMAAPDQAERDRHIEDLRAYIELAADLGCGLVRTFGGQRARDRELHAIADYVADLRGLIHIARERHPGLPVFLLGHSAGGVTACTYALDYQDEIEGLICESFAFQVPAPGFLLSAIKGLSRLAPHLGVLTLHMKDFTRDPAALAALEADPLTKGETQPAATVAALVRADERLHDAFGDITLPVLILHGTADKATVCHGSEYFHAHAGSIDKTLKLYEGHYHDLLNDIGKEDVLSDVATWIEARMVPETQPESGGAIQPETAPTT